MQVYKESRSRRQTAVSSLYQLCRPPDNAHLHNWEKVNYPSRQSFLHIKVNGCYIRWVKKSPRSFQKRLRGLLLVVRGASSQMICSIYKKYSLRRQKSFPISMASPGAGRALLLNLCAEPCSLISVNHTWLLPGVNCSVSVACPSNRNQRNFMEEDRVSPCCRESGSGPGLKQCCLW